DVGDLARFESADLIGKSENLCRIECNGLQRFVVGKAVGNRVGRVLAEAAGEGVVEASDCEANAGFVKLGGLREENVVGIVFLGRFGEHGPQNAGDVLGVE